MNTTKISTLITLAKIIEKYKGNWSYASQKTILALLKQYHGITINLRALNYHLSDLRKLGLIRTYKRHHRNPDGTCVLLSSATALTIKGCAYLYAKGVDWTIKQMRYLKSRYTPPQPAPTKSEKINPPDANQIEKQPSNKFLERCKTKNILVLDLAPT